MWKKNLTKFFFHLKHKNKEMFKSLRIKYFKISYFSLSLNVSAFLKNIINNGIVKNGIITPKLRKITIQHIIVSLPKSFKQYSNITKNTIAAKTQASIISIELNIFLEIYL